MLSSLFLPLPESPAGFEELKNSGSYFVDKTEYIKTVFTDSATVLLFTRPRRFGNTLLMTMFESFLKINKDKPFDTSLQFIVFQELLCFFLGKANDTGVLPFIIGNTVYRKVVYSRKQTVLGDL